LTGVTGADGWGRDHDTAELLVSSDPASWSPWRWRLRRALDRIARVLLAAAELAAGPWHQWAPRPLPNGAELVVTTYPYGLGCAGECGRVFRVGDLTFSFDEGPVDADDPDSLLRWTVVGYCAGCAAERELRQLT
jgi:hypothetical protein